MTQPPPLKETARQLQIRSAPKPATRINRKLLLSGAGLGALGLFAAATFALAPPRPPEPARQNELLAAGKRKPDGFSALPADYAALGDVPVLGAPVSGDLGATIRAAEQAYGIEPDFQSEYRTDFRSRPEQEIETSLTSLARLIDRYGDAYWPVFERLERELSIRRERRQRLSVHRQHMGPTR